MKVLLITSSVRENRSSIRVSRFLEKYINENNLAEVDTADLNEYNFPIFDERLKFQKNPSDLLVKFSNQVSSADAIIFVIPEYNSGYPAAFKNAFDVLVSEWYRKPIGISSVSAGNFGGIMAGNQAQTVIMKLKGVAIPSTYAIPLVNKTFDENGNIIGDIEFMNKKTKAFLDELLWFAEAFNRMKD